jgi:hypothetical protein
MNRFVLSMLLVLAAGSASAATCSDQAADKKLAGAALKSFIGKCERPLSKDLAAAAASARRECLRTIRSITSGFFPRPQ